MEQIFKPKLIDTLKGYSWQKFGQDAMAGLIVGIVALPLAIAFAIASGVSPEKGLVTAVVAGFLISVLGGSRVQIGGPTGAFIVIVYGIVVQYGVNGLIVATFIAGIMLILMGLARLGSIIKYIPHSLIVGFTSGIAVIIFSSQVKDFFGLQMGTVPADFIHKWRDYFSHFTTIDFYALGIAVATILIIYTFPLLSKKIPGSLVAILLTTLAVHFFEFPVETIGSRFGSIQANVPTPEMPGISLDLIRKMIQPAFTIAMLGAIESLLSAVVADSMTGGNHRSNTELIGQGIANIGSSLFGGIPATGAIARTATNVKNGGRTPVAGIVHAMVLFLILIFLGKWASYIPLSCLAGVLVVIAINMSEYKNFLSILKGPRGDIAVMLTTFLLTVLVDLTLAIQVGIILAAFSFIQKMVSSSKVQFAGDLSDEGESDIILEEEAVQLPENVGVLEISGPMFFGASYKIKEAVRFMDKLPRILIIRMRHVPVIDATGIHSFKEVIAELAKKGTKIILAELTSTQVSTELKTSRIAFKIGKGNIFSTLAQAVQRAERLIAEAPRK